MYDEISIRHFIVMKNDSHCIHVPGSFKNLTFSVQNDNGHDNERYQSTECSNCTNSNGRWWAITRIEIHSSGHSLGRLLLVSCIRLIMQDTTQGIDFRFTVLVPSWYMGADVKVKSPAVILPICTWFPCWILWTRKLLIAATLILHGVSGMIRMCTLTQSWHRHSDQIKLVQLGQQS